MVHSVTVVTVDVLVQRSVRHVLVNKNRHVQLDAAAEELHEILVAYLAEDLNLVDDLVYALLVPELGSFHGDRCPVVEVSFENLPESAEAEEV